MKPETTKPPVFIHSLFRAGSTYLFNVFRRSGAGYWCYQEPIHEFVLLSQGNHELLLTIGKEMEAALRHPGLSAPYFLELYQVADQCLNSLRKSAVYDSYFTGPDDEFDGEYWQGLIGAARGRPVIQECRTACRIGAMRKSLGGFHLYLWRNPWDQWWSYKVDEYFNAVNLLIINAARHPEIIWRLRREIGFGGYDNDLPAQIAWFKSHPLPPEQAYLVFYILWYLGLREGMAHANLLLNIDRLADSPEYRSGIIDFMSGSGIEGVDFSDCVIPQCHYAQADSEFFRCVEDKAHGLLLLSGTPQHDIDHVLEVRRAHEPKAWADVGGPSDRAGLIRDGERARALVRKSESREAVLRSTFSHQLQTQEKLVRAGEAAAAEQALRAQTAESLAAAQTRRAEEQEQNAKAAEAVAAEQARRAQAAESLAAEQTRRADAALFLAGAHEQRTKAAESSVSEQERRAKAAEAAAAEQMRRAEAALLLAAEQEQRAKAAEVSAEQSGRAAESRAAEQERRAYAAEVLKQEQRRRVDELVAESDYWRDCANAFETERNALRQSWSWRMTAPGRYMLGVVTHGQMAMRRHANQVVLNATNSFQRVLAVGMRSVLKNKTLSRFISQRLIRYPGLYQRLLGVARRGGVIPNGVSTYAPPTSAAAHSDAPGLSTLSPQARKIYGDLKTAIERRQTPNS